MTLNELMEYGDKMINQHPDQKDLIFIGVDDCLENNLDGDERLDHMHAWITRICTENARVDPISQD